MKKIRVFPDHSSTGLWDAETGESVVVPECIGKSNTLALKFWHGLWEWFAESSGIEYDDVLSDLEWSWLQKWKEDGAALVEQMNLCQDEYEFVLDVDLNCDGTFDDVDVPVPYMTQEFVNDLLHDVTSDAEVFEDVKPLKTVHDISNSVEMKMLLQGVL